ncbi:MAG: hypothetical protein JSU70_10790 [Phycisphaerales bacterium]|nr:MAG: hypothetical protein JSU70_10790 [Phycisphaerales bacterium]
MIQNEKLKELLHELGQREAEPARPDLAEDIKKRIPHRLIPHAMDTINIMIDLRISRLAAAAVIVITMVLLASFMGGRGSLGYGTYEDSKLFLKYCLGGEDACRSDMLAGLAGFYEEMVERGRDVTYYGNRVDPDDAYAVLMHWKLPNGKYGVILGDLSARTVSPAALIRLQARMLQEHPK